MAYEIHLNWYTTNNNEFIVQEEIYIRMN